MIAGFAQQILPFAPPHHPAWLRRTNRAIPTLWLAVVYVLQTGGVSLGGKIWRAAEGNFGPQARRELSVCAPQRRRWHWHLWEP
jgi:hypothetical protein